ncbi:MAG: DUF3575 domain-containing protein [Flavobacteriales bacterium]
MKLHCLFLVAFIAFADVTNSQTVEPSPTHKLKGRALWMGERFGHFRSFGIGYEHLLGKSVSVQLMANYFGFDSERYQDLYTCIVPEVRYYFNKRRCGCSAFFVGAFTEAALVRHYEDYIMCFPPYDPPAVTHTFQINPGLLAGKNFCMGSHFRMEVFAGVKMVNERNQNTPFASDALALYDKWNTPRVGYRGGVNLAYAW